MGRRQGAPHEGECYALNSVGATAVLPPTGVEENHRTFAYKPVDEQALEELKRDWLRSRRLTHRRIETIDVALVVDDERDPEAIFVAVPMKFGGTASSRLMGHLSEGYQGYVGAILADLSAGFEEVLCTGVVLGEFFIYLDLPRPRVLIPAVREFLQGRDMAVSPRSAGGRLEPGGVKRSPVRHTQSSEITDDVLRQLRNFPDQLPVENISVRTARGWATPRSLEVRELASGRKLGAVAMGYLFLEDERDRPAVLARLVDIGVSVAQPSSRFEFIDDEWSAESVPNMWTYWFVERLDFRPRDPKVPRTQVSLAHYNPTTKKLWIEDSRLAAAALLHAARLGLQVADVGLPGMPWQLESEVPFYELKDTSLKLRSRHEVSVNVQLLNAVRKLVSDDLFPAQDLAWISSPAVPPYHPESDEQFVLHERHVRERGVLFGKHQLSSTISPCRLCGRPSLAFTAAVCSDHLSYCHECLHHATTGIVRARSGRSKNNRRAAQALQLLGKYEFGGSPMLEDQLDTLHVDPRSPVPSQKIDQLLLLRFAISRRQHPWTYLLEEAGFAEDGLRGSRGTLIRARDGHRCLSLLEKAVCDFLHQHEIQHDREPMYPPDAELNPYGLRRADWLLADGTLVELWGLPKQRDYATKMDQKRALAARHGIALVELFEVDMRRLPEVFAKWLPAGSDPVTAWSWSPIGSRTESREPVVAAGSSKGGGNDFNLALQIERLERCDQAVRLQSAGHSRAAIEQELGVSAGTVSGLLRDGKFYADPATDTARLSIARAAAVARQQGDTRVMFQNQLGLSAQKAHEAWRDASIVGRSLGT